MKRIRLTRLIISPSFVVCTTNALHDVSVFSHHLHSFSSTHVSVSIGNNFFDADVINIDVFTTIQLPK
jgi:hypothetical protein